MSLCDDWERGDECQRSGEQRKDALPLITAVDGIRVAREFWLVHSITVDEVNGDERRHHEGS